MRWDHHTLNLGTAYVYCNKLVRTFEAVVGKKQQKSNSIYHPLNRTVLGKNWTRLEKVHFIYLRRIAG